MFNLSFLKIHSLTATHKVTNDTPNKILNTLRARQNASDQHGK